MDIAAGPIRRSWAAGSADSLAESRGPGAGTGKSPQLVPKDEEHCEAPNAEEGVYNPPE